MGPDLFGKGGAEHNSVVANSDITGQKTQVYFIHVAGIKNVVQIT